MKRILYSLIGAAMLYCSGVKADELPNFEMPEYQFKRPNHLKGNSSTYNIKQIKLTPKTEHYNNIDDIIFQEENMFPGLEPRTPETFNIVLFRF